MLIFFGTRWSHPSLKQYKTFREHDVLADKQTLSLRMSIRLVRLRLRFRQACAVSFG
jgi:hypothetical protein